MPIANLDELHPLMAVAHDRAVARDATVSARARLPAQRFVPDSPLEEDGFEPSVPREREAESVQGFAPLR
jgi:hypothetical protein